MQAVAYARFSSDNQRAESVDAQLYDIDCWAAANRAQILAVYKDEAETGTNDDRDDFLRMIADLQNGYTSDGIDLKQVQAVLVHKTDRFARNKWDSAIYKKLLHGIDIRVIYVIQPMLNEDSPEAFLMEGVFEALDQYYSMNLGREVMKGHNTNARACKHNGGIPPLGFNVDRETLLYTVNDHEAMAVNKIFTMYDASMGYKTIIKELNDGGFKTKTGRPFATNSIAEILRNEKYIGTYVYNRRQHKLKGKRNNRKDKPEDKIIRVPDGLPRIIEQDLWDRVQARIASRAKQPGERAHNKAKVEYLLTGLIECSECGYKMVGKNGGTYGEKVRYDYYICNNRERTKQCEAKMIRRDVIEHQVLEEIEKRILNPQVFPDLAAEIHQGLKKIGGESEKELIYLKAELAKNQGKITNLLDLVEEGAGTKQLLDRLQQRETEQAVLENRLAEIERKAKSGSITIDMILDLLKKDYETLKGDTMLTAKGLIDRYVHKVIIYPGEFEVIFKFLHTDGGGDPSHLACRNVILRAKDLYNN